MANIVKVWNLPKDHTLSFLLKLEESIISAVENVPDAQMERRTVGVILTSGMLQDFYGVCLAQQRMRPIFVEICFLEYPWRTAEIKEALARNVCRAVMKLYPFAYVECICNTTDETQGWWPSGKG